jgi:hypothetical protein
MPTELKPANRDKITGYGLCLKVGKWTKGPVTMGRILGNFKQVVKGKRARNGKRRKR